MKKLLLLIPLFAMAGCADINRQIVRGVNAYCGEPLATRQAVRASVNSALAVEGHSIVVTCRGDVE